MSSIGDARYNYFVNSPANILVDDRMFVGDVFRPALVNGGTFNIGFTTGSKAPTLISFIMSDRSDQTEIEIYEGGVFSAGTPIEFSNTNRAKNLINPPFITSAMDVVIDTVGNRIRRLTILGSTDKKNVTTITRDTGMILAPNMNYYMSIRNDDNTGNSDYDLQFVIASGEY